MSAHTNEFGEDAEDVVCVTSTSEATTKKAKLSYETMAIIKPTAGSSSEFIPSELFEIFKCNLKKKRFALETNSSIRNRHKKRLLGKIKQLVDELSMRTGQQATVLFATVDPVPVMHVFGTSPLEHIVRGMKSSIMDALKTALSLKSAPHVKTDRELFNLPPLVMDGIPLPVEQMTQTQLRSFIPLIVKYSTGSAKPGWGKETNRPPWWPQEIPWANIRIDTRSYEEKRTMSWTNALRKIVLSCYTYHGRLDLLPDLTHKDSIGYNDQYSQTFATSDTYEIQQPQDDTTMATEHFNNEMMQIKHFTLTPDGSTACVGEKVLIQQEHIAVEKIILLGPGDSGSFLINLPPGTTCQYITDDQPDPDRFGSDQPKLDLHGNVTSSFGDVAGTVPNRPNFNQGFPVNELVIYRNSTPDSVAAN